jgi:hypothetical protein
MKSVVYFIEGQIGIKIGCSTDLKTRFATLRSEYGSDLKILGVKVGGASLETKLQKRFAHHFIYKKEWFAKHPEIYKYIKKYTSPDFKPYFLKAVPVSDSTYKYIQCLSKATGTPTDEIVLEAILGHYSGIDAVITEYHEAVRRIPLIKHKS